MARPDGPRRAGRRADARRNEDEIVDAAVACLGHDPAASVAKIAAEAGLGRVTLYGHFSTREALVEAALVRVLSRGEAVLNDVDLSGDPRAALAALVEASWRLTAEASGVLEAARPSVAPERIRELHADAERRVHGLLRRGQAAGLFRDDLPVAWLAGVIHFVMKGAAAEAAAGNLDPVEADRYVRLSILASVRPPTD